MVFCMDFDSFSVIFSVFSSFPFEKICHFNEIILNNWYLSIYVNNSQQIFNNNSSLCSCFKKFTQ